MYTTKDMKLRLDADFAPTAEPEGFVLIGRNRKFVFRTPLSPELLSTANLLRAGEHTADQAVLRVCGTGASANGGRVNSFIAALGKLGLLSTTLTANGHRVMRLVPLVANRQPRAVNVISTKRYVLSRFAFMRKLEERFVIESPLSFHRVELLHPASVSFVFALMQTSLPAELETILPEDMRSCGSQLLDVLLAAGVADESDADGRELQEDAGLRQWEFHDLLFHARSRSGRTDPLLGRTFRFLNQIEPLPALKAPSSRATIQLAKVDVEALRQSDTPFTEVLETRRSIRRFGSVPITLRELGEFLFRVARVRRIHPRESKKLYYESSDRPYPGGGGGYELEIYAIVDRCDCLPKDVYHYDAFNHQLELLASDERARNALLDYAAQANGTGERPQVLFVMTARFQRVNWKYESMAYATILKDVGVLYQSMYLVATAMRLAPCAVGSGDPHPLGDITGDPYWIESSVGEFMLGSLPDKPYSQF